MHNRGDERFLYALMNLDVSRHKRYSRQHPVITPGR
jgi:hypothetical protein